MSLEVIYRRTDGVFVRSLAYYSHRCGPMGEWVIGDVPLDKLDGTILSKRPWDVSMWGRDWAAAFQKPSPKA